MPDLVVLGRGSDCHHLHQQLCQWELSQSLAGLAVLSRAVGWPRSPMLLQILNRTPCEKFGHNA